MAHLSFHAGTEGKLKASNIKGVMRHAMRNSKHGYKNHSNKDIDTSKTKDNLDWTIDRKPLDETVKARLENEYKGKRAMRKDAVLLREIIIQPSPDVFEGLNDEEKREKALDFMKDSHDWFDKEFGVQNVIGMSLHMDETNPHAHMFVMPMTKDGRVAQKEFFKGPNDFKRQHREYREHMNSRGWDFEVDNKYENSEGVTLKEYKANAEAIDAKREGLQAKIDELSADVDVQAEAFELAYKNVYPQVEKKAYDDAYENVKAVAYQDAREDAYKDVHAVLLRDERERVAKEREEREKAEKERERVQREQEAKREAERVAALEKNRGIAEKIVRREGVFHPDKPVDTRLLDAYIEKHQEMNGKKMKTLGGGMRDVITTDIYRSAESKYKNDLKVESQVQVAQQQSQELER